MLVALLMPLALVGFEPQAPSAPSAPSAKEAEALVKEYVGLDGKVAAGRVRQDEILSRLAALPPLTAKEAETWKKQVGKLTARARA
jgi:hypothetical protein